MSVLKLNGPITSRAMFGGYGIYYEKAMFAAIFANELYFRTDPTIDHYFDVYKSKYFTYTYPDGKLIQLPYRTLPIEVFENQHQLEEWIIRSSRIALHAKIKKQNKLKKTLSLSEFV